MYNSSKKSISKIISIFLICSLLFCAYSTNSFAYTDYVYHPTDFSVTMINQVAQPNGAITDYSSTAAYTTQTSGGITYYRYYNTNTNYYSSGYTKEIHMVRITDLSITHEYEFSMYTRMFAAVGYSAEFYLVDGNGTILTVLSYDNISSDLGNSNHLIKFGFTLENLNLSTNADVFLKIVFQVSSWYQYNFQLGMSDITLRDLDDDTGFFESIINWIRTVANDITSGVTSLVNSISNLGTNIGSWFTNLGNNISTWLTTLGNNISTWLTNVKDGIVNKLQSVQTAITNAIDGIQQWFVNLGNRIGEFFTMLKNYILYFQHPVTLNADGVPVDANGNPVYTNPFEDTLQSVSDTLDDWFDSLDDFILTIQSVNVQITGYLQTFTNIFNRFNAGVPIMGVIITLALIVIVIKKIMGR